MSSVRAQTVTARMAPAHHLGWNPLDERSVSALTVVQHGLQGRKPTVGRNNNGR